MPTLLSRFCAIPRLIALSAAFLVPWSWATDIKCPDRPFRVAFDDRGFNYFKGVGFDLDLARELEKRSGCAMVFSEMPRARIFIAMERGDVDMALFAIATPERDRYAWFAPYMAQKNYVYLTPGLSKAAQTPAAFESNSKLLFGVVRGYTHGPFYEALLVRLRAKNRVVEVASTEQLFQMLVKGRVHAAMSLPTVTTFYAQDMVPELGGLAGLDWDNASPAPAHQLMLSKHNFSETDARAWQELMADMVRDGTVRATIARYVRGRDLQRSLLH